MRGSSIFRSPPAQRHTARALLLAALAVLGVVRPAHALDPARASSQYIRDAWGSERGFPGGPVYGITQTADGYLWIAAEKGLVRFDGLNFRLFEPAGLTSGIGPTVLGVAAAADGSLWARLRGPALVRFRNGTFENMLSDVGLPESVVTAMLRGRGDAILLATLGNGTVAYRGGRFNTIAAPTAVPTSSFVISIAEARDGEVWLGTRDAGLLRVQGPRVTRLLQGLPDPKINSLLAGDNGDVWIGTDKGVARWTGTEITAAGVPDALASLPAFAMIRDRDANVWIASARGLLRVNSRGVATLDASDSRTAGTVTAVFEDRDGNVWVGTTKGIERLRDGVFTTYGLAQGLPAESIGPVHVDAAQRTWFAPADGGLYWLRDGQVGRVDVGGLNGDVVYSLAGRGDDIWIGRQRGGLTRLRPLGGTFTAEQFTQAEGLAQNSVYAVYQARDGAVWAGTLSGGASRLKDGAFTTYARSNGLASNTVASIVESSDGTMWFATPNGISTLSRGGWRRYSIENGLPSNDVNVLFEDSTGSVWAGTAAGPAVFDGGQLQSPLDVPAVLRAAVLGFAEDRSGALWIATADRVVRAHREDLRRGISGDGGAIVREYGVADGLMALEGVKRHRSLIADSGGRVWLATTRGLSMADPSHVDAREVPALSHIEDVSADGVSVDLRKAVEIPAGRRRVTVSYAGLSLSVPERVLFRYRLDGFDRDWSAPVSERQAVYTNLNPGAYVFRVTASNSDGIWNGAETAMRFDVEPSVWQTAWFRISGLGLMLMAVWAVYRLRVFGVARQLNMRFEERLAERTRIAQELHDTLLQGFVSASMQLHVAADRLPADSPAKPSLVRVQELMGRVIDEGRNAVRGLRSSGGAPHDLEESFSGIHEELALDKQIDFRVIIEGQARPLTPLIRDEVYRIGREALVNAFRHSGGTSIEIELEYGEDDLRMLVRDDGRGIDAAVVQSGTDGHWGIAGMRERAASIGAALKIRSRTGAGTEVELTVPGDVAFDRQVTPRTRGWTSGMFRRRISTRPSVTEKRL